MSIDLELIRKYNVAGPRYTSYPTVPYWEGDNLAVADWQHLCQKTFDESNIAQGISLYIHLPFCEKLCTFCGCNKRITVNHAVEEPYIDTLLKEWNMYLACFSQQPIVREIHLGGGTPTFFSAQNLSRLISNIDATIARHPDFELSYEAHPNVTTQEQLQVLYDMGSRRISFGIQDFDDRVQIAINRVQTYDQVALVTHWARQIGYHSINYDIIYGLPYQQLSSIETTMSFIGQLRPERIAFYSYAHVPWMAKSQRGYDENNLPQATEKRALYERGRALLFQYGYHEIAMDHFALENDPLLRSSIKGTLHRNFMGYTPHHTSLMIGLGVSAISDSWTAYAQNNKSFEDYVKLVSSGTLPIYKGHILTEEDLYVRVHILNLICRFTTTFDNKTRDKIMVYKERLLEMELDRLIHWHENTLSVSNKGRTFIRNICMALDERLYRQQATTQLFSQTI